METDGVLCEIRVETIETLYSPNISWSKIDYTSPLSRYLDVYEVLIIIDCKYLLLRFGGISQCVLRKACKVTRIANVFLENIQEPKI
jgi:hypothetical protein